MKYLQIIKDLLKLTGIDKFNPDISTFKKESLKVLMLSEENKLVWMLFNEVVTSSNLTPVSATESGIVNNTSLQELGGVDKLINGIRIGKGNGNIASNTGIGISILRDVTGTYNTMGGYFTGYKTSTGSFNTGFGGSCLTLLLTGSRNVAFGSSALYNISSGDSNTAIGTAALAGQVGVTLGTYLRNIALGASAGNALVTGNDNILIGSDLSPTVSQGLFNGNLNTIIGKLNNSHNTGDANTFIGRVTSPTTTLSANIIISDGNGIVGIRKTDTHQLLAPSLTQALIISGGTTSLVNKEYVDNSGAVVNATAVALTAANLNAAYPNALIGFRVHCMSIAGGGLVYEKTIGGWISQTATAVV